MRDRPVYMSKDPKVCAGCGSPSVIYRDPKVNIGWCKNCRRLAEDCVGQNSIAGLARYNAEWEEMRLRIGQMRDASGWSGRF